VSERATPVVMLGRWLRLVAVVIAAAVFAAAAVGVTMGVAAAGDPGVRAMTKMWPIKQDPIALDQRAWVQMYGGREEMPNLRTWTPPPRSSVPPRPIC
jgi:hypothetical protein